MQARRIVQNLEYLRLALELHSFRYGMPTNLLPIPRRDYTAYTGGEGTITHGYHTLLAIAQHLKLVDTLEPEWWPA